MDKNQRGMDGLLRDVKERQRNIVFPDTVRNEGYAFRNLMHGSQSHPIIVRVGAAVVGLMFLFSGCVMIATLQLPALLIGAFLIAVGLKFVITATFPKKPMPPPDDHVKRRRRLSGFR
jgi:hypothetical protein